MKDKPRRTHNTCTSHTHTHTHTHCSACSALFAHFHIKDDKLLDSVFRENEKRNFLKQDWAKEWVMNRQKKGENVGREKSLRQVIIVCVLLVDVLSELRERRRCPSRVLNVHLSWQFLFFQRYTNSTAHRSSQPGGVVMLSYWLEKWWLSACVGAVLSGCIVSGCLCNLDVHREAKFSIMMWSHAIKTLVYSLVCLYFGQFIVYIIKYVEVFQVFCLILYPRASCKCHFTLCREISVKRSLLYVWPCRREKILVSRSALSEPRWLLPLFVYCKKKEKKEFCSV